MSSDESVRIELADQSYPIDKLLARFRPYLRLIAARQLDSILAADRYLDTLDLDGFESDNKE